MNEDFKRYFQHEFEGKLKLYRKRNELREAGKKMAKDRASAERRNILEFK
jgi:hypothetical protein